MTPKPPRRKMTKLDMVIYWLCLALIMYSLYLLWETSEHPNPRLRMLAFCQRLCQYSARVLGQWGIQAERAYHTLAERERTF